MKKRKIAVAMSGGVDSSLVASLLKEQGFDIVGLTMKHLSYGSEYDKMNKPCCSLEDILDAKKICNRLGAMHYTVNMQDIFKEKIIDYFVEEYRLGSTPNPCVKCNRDVKLGALLKYAKELGADSLATGHYAIFRDEKLYMANDREKDQSYFLSQVRREDLNCLIFPLGGMTKDEVRRAALKRNLVSSSKPDSQGICFIPTTYKDFLSRIFKDRSGEIVNRRGEVLGRHSGLHNYTVGQRRGIGISSDRPYYVLELNRRDNRLVIGLEEELFRDKFRVTNINILVDDSEILFNSDLYVKARARDPLVRARLQYVDDSSVDNNSVDSSSADIKFMDGAKALTPGQVAVFYSKENQVLGSGLLVRDY